MNRPGPMPFAGILCLFLVAAAAPVRAAESYDNCSAFVTSLPATIATQGTWCFDRDLSGNLASGAAIIITTNNVTLDCNGFKVGNLAAGPANTAVGVQAVGRANVTVRGCNLRGYHVGVALTGSGHLVEDNRLEGSGYIGINVGGDGSTVRRNFVFDTGNTSHDPYAAIAVSGVVDVVDNSISVVAGQTGANANAVGIFMDPGRGARIQGNAVRGLLAAGTGTPYGIFINNTGGGVSVTGNRLSQDGPSAGSGVQCAGLPASPVSDTHSIGFEFGFSGCIDVGLNHQQ